MEAVSSAEHRSSPRLRTAACLLGVALGCLSTGCEDDFADYNVVADFRLLAMGAEAPALHQGETATLRALVTDSQATYSWSWCPVHRGINTGFDCAVTHDQLQGVINELIGPGAPPVPPFDLGTGAEAQFEYSFTADQARGLCLGLFTALPADAVPPDCAGDAFVIVIRLQTEADGKTITSVRDLDLLYDAATTANANPFIGGLSATAAGQSIPILDDGSTVLARDTSYELTLEVAEDQAETYLKEGESTRERLGVTWFLEGGDMDRTRTSFFEGERGFDNLVGNTWRTPTVEEFSGGVTRLFMVIRDDRRGTRWIERSVVLEGTP